MLRSSPCNLEYLYLTLVLVLEVVQTVAALSLPGRLEVSQELLVAGVSPAELLHCDELLVFYEKDAVTVARREQIDDKFLVYSLVINASRLVLLDLLEDIFAVISNSNSRGHYQSLQAVWKDKVCRREAGGRSEWKTEPRGDLGQLLMPAVAVYEAALPGPSPLR